MKNPFEYQKASEKTSVLIQGFMLECKKLHELIILTIPESRERSLAITKLEETAMWGNKALAFNQEGNHRLSEDQCENPRHDHFLSTGPECRREGFK